MCLSHSFFSLHRQIDDAFFLSSFCMFITKSLVPNAKVRERERERERKGKKKAAINACMQRYFLFALGNASRVYFICRDDAKHLVDWLSIFLFLSCHHKARAAGEAR